MQERPRSAEQSPGEKPAAHDAPAVRPVVAWSIMLALGLTIWVCSLLFQQPDGKVPPWGWRLLAVFVPTILGLMLRPLPGGAVVLWDLSKVTIPPELQQARSELLWELLGERDAAKAYLAICVLTGRPVEAVALIGKDLEPAPVVTDVPAEIRRLIARLDAASFREREAAAKSLVDFGPETEALLKAALASKPSLEVRLRLERILESLREPSPQQIRGIRAIEILERVGSVEAQRLLRRLASGRPGHPLTEDARATLGRLAPSK
jgi:hypothetical protein